MKNDEKKNFLVTSLFYLDVSNRQLREATRRARATCSDIRQRLAQNLGYERRNAQIYINRLMGTRGPHPAELRLQDLPLRPRRIYFPRQIHKNKVLVHVRDINARPHFC